VLFDLDGGVGNDIGVSKEVKHLVVLLVLPCCSWCRGVTWSVGQSRQKQARDHQGKIKGKIFFDFFLFFGGMMGL